MAQCVFLPSAILRKMACTKAFEIIHLLSTITCNTDSRKRLSRVWHAAWIVMNRSIHALAWNDSVRFNEHLPIAFYNLRFCFICNTGSGLVVCHKLVLIMPRILIIVIITPAKTQYVWQTLVICPPDENVGPARQKRWRSVWDA
eukprot:scaffold85612_cov29-Prasinocladus_malaysianus.AAC.1